MDIVDALEAQQKRPKDLKPFEVGDTVRLNVRIIEGSKERPQLFQGVVVQKANRGSRRTFTVRKVTGGVGVERVFPMHSPNVLDIEVVRHGSVRRARLFYLRERSGKAARIRERRTTPGAS